MKRLFFYLLVLMACPISAQEAYWTNYNVVVEPQDVYTFSKLMDDYFTAHQPEGVTVNLWENHFNDHGSNFTHTVSFVGSLEAMAAMYGNDGGDAWQLFLVQLNQHVKEGYSSAMGRSLGHNGDLEKNYPVQMVYVVHVEDNTAWDKAIMKYMNTNDLPELTYLMGDVASGASPEGENRWVLEGFKDFKSAIGGADAMRTDAQKAADAKAWKEFLDTNGESHLIRSALWVRLGQWK